MSSSSSSSTSYPAPPTDSNSDSPTTSTSTSTSKDTPPPKKPLALPPTSSSTSYDPSTQTTQLDLSQGDTSIKLDHLGPMVVNVDGTLSRISNWAEMADVERETTLRIIGRRNKGRLEVLRAKEEGEGKEGEGK